MKLELIEIETDTIPLDGLFYEPEEKPAKGAIMSLLQNGLSKIL